jgi:hypothetical protein
VSGRGLVHSVEEKASVPGRWMGHGDRRVPVSRLPPARPIRPGEVDSGCIYSAWDFNDVHSTAGYYSYSTSDIWSNGFMHKLITYERL